MIESMISLFISVNYLLSDYYGILSKINIRERESLISDTH